MLCPPPGYRLQEGTQSGIPDFRALMALVDLGTWGEANLIRTISDVLPRSWHVLIHKATGALVATGMGLRRPIPDLYPNGYEVDWIAAHPLRAGHGLGRVIVAATVVRLLELEGRCMYLQTDDFRLAALKTYLRLGF